jgi:hypothetical protein
MALLAAADSYSRRAMQRAQLLRQLVLDSHYVIDEHEVAGAILARALTHDRVAAARFRNDVCPPLRTRVRSFRPSPHARSFRPSRPPNATHGLAGLV